MDDFNSIVLEGHVVRDPETRETPKGTGICLFPIAVNRAYRASTGERKQEVSFFDIETWGNLADACAKYCNKGRGIRVVGRLKQNRWQDTEGKTQSRIKIVAEHVDFKPKFNSNKIATEQKNRQEIKDLVEAAIADRELLGGNPTPRLCEAVF
ncbi:MAG: single-stranded DNA-binding protein [Spirochaetaceae bacterium]|nr:single-stranded DNA-binding protein [Spirochaetaceae bacterium]